MLHEYGFITVPVIRYDHAVVYVYHVSTVHVHESSLLVIVSLNAKPVNRPPENADPKI